jgi:GTPase SAR1 family protein
VVSLRFVTRYFNFSLKAMLRSEMLIPLTLKVVVLGDGGVGKSEYCRKASAVVF